MTAPILTLGHAKNSIVSDGEVAEKKEHMTFLKKKKKGKK